MLEKRISEESNWQQWRETTERANEQKRLAYPVSRREQVWCDSGHQAAPRPSAGNLPFPCENERKVRGVSCGTGLHAGSSLLSCHRRIRSTVDYYPSLIVSRTPCFDLSQSGRIGGLALPQHEEERKVRVLILLPQAKTYSKARYSTLPLLYRLTPMK